MFLKDFELTEPPFGSAADPKFLYFGSEHREAISSLYLGIQEGRGVTAIVGAPGIWKTTLLKYLITRVSNRTVSAFLDHPFDDKKNLIRAVLFGLGLDASDDGEFQQWCRLRDYFLLQLGRGRQVILAFDEVQTLSVEVLEQIRLFSTLETSRRRMVEIVLAGQLSFAEKLNLPEMYPLRQRIGLLTHLEPLRPDGVHEYIRHRLKIAGRERDLFTPRAVAEIARVARGIPRTINHLCHNAMALAWARGENKVRNEFVLQAAQDLEARPGVAEELDGPALADQGGFEIAARPADLSAGQFGAAANAPRHFSGPRYPNEQVWTPRQLAAAGETPSPVSPSAEQPLHERSNGTGSAQEFVEGDGGTPFEVLRRVEKDAPVESTTSRGKTFGFLSSLFGKRERNRRSGPTRIIVPTAAEGDDAAVPYEAESPHRPTWIAEVQPPETPAAPVSNAAPEWEEISETGTEQNEYWVKPLLKDRAEPAVFVPAERPFQREPPGPEPTDEGIPMPSAVENSAPQQEARRDSSLFLTFPKGMF